MAPQATKAVHEDEVKRFRVGIKSIAERLDAESFCVDESRSHPIHERHRRAQATTVLQVPIAMAAIALRTQRKWLVHGVFVLGAIGAGIGTPAWTDL